MNKFDYTYSDIEKALGKIGIAKGDNLFVHSNIGFFGRLENVKTADELCGNFLKAFKNVLTPEGTFVLPTFSYSFCHNEEYDPAVTMSNCGILPNYAIKQDDMIRSLDPNFSITAWGHNAEFYTADPSHESFGKGSVWERFLSTGGKLVCMNFDCGSTFVHYVEKYRNVDYRFNKSFNGVIVTKDGRRYRDYAVHFVHDENDTKTVFGKLDAKCREAGICKVSNLGKGTLLAIDIKDYYDLINKGLDSDPDFLRDRG